MNVYDFDKTIFPGDSTARFYACCVLHNPKILRRLPRLIFEAVTLLKRDKQRFKQHMFAFLTDLKDPEAAVEAFWNRNIGRIKPFYLAQKRPDDIIISASPEFLIAPAMARLGIKNVLASPVDIHTGVYSGPNCHGAEKVRRLKEAFGEVRIEAFYSDSHCDDPLAAISEKAYLVKGNRLLPWE